MQNQAKDIADELKNSLLKTVDLELFAIWQYGSSVFGHPFIDVDLHIIMTKQLQTETWEAIQDIHKKIAEDYNLQLDELDFWYILLNDAINNKKPKHIGTWANNLIDDCWALHRAHWLAGRLIVIYGPEPVNIIKKPEWNELEEDLLNEIKDPQPSPYWVLQLCRVCASLFTHDVVRSKLDSGMWALKNLPKVYQPIIQAAMSFYEKKSLNDDESIIKINFSMFHLEIQKQIKDIYRKKNK